MTVIDLIINHEKSVPIPYLDSEGIRTVGVGHNLEAHPLSGETYPMAPDRIREVLSADLQTVVMGLGQNLPWMQTLDEVRQAVLIDLGFNLGVAGLLRFRHTLACVEAHDWQGAHDNLLASEPWASQVGPRAVEDANMMLTGLWPDDPAFPQVC